MLSSVISQSDSDFRSFKGPSCVLVLTFERLRSNFRAFICFSFISQRTVRAFTCSFDFRSFKGPLCVLVQSVHV